MIFLAPNFECFTNYDAFYLYSFDYECLRRLRHIVVKRFEIMKKFYSSKPLLKMAGGGDAFPHPLLDWPLTKWYVTEVFRLLYLRQKPLKFEL